MKFLCIVMVLTMAVCGYEGDDMPAHNLRIDNVTFDEALAGCWVGQVRAVGSRQSVPNATMTTVEYDSVDWDHGDCWDETTNHEYVAKSAGLYAIKAQIHIGTTTPSLYLEVDSGSGYVAVVRADAGAFTAVSILAYSLAVGDKVRIRVIQSSGGAVDIYGLKASTFVSIQQVVKL